MEAAIIKIAIERTTVETLEEIWPAKRDSSPQSHWKCSTMPNSDLMIPVKLKESKS